MSGSAGVMALVLAETVAGAAAFLWLTPLWREVKRGIANGRVYEMNQLLLGTVGAKSTSAAARG